MRPSHSFRQGAGCFLQGQYKKKALELGLKGYAKNLPDGNVEVVAQGNEEKIKELIEFIKIGPGIAKVENIQLKHKETENFDSFVIRH